MDQSENDPLHESALATCDGLRLSSANFFSTNSLTTTTTTTTLQF
jgi:hypothetical protein